jgi:hypothetical protein
MRRQGGDEIVAHLAVDAALQFGSPGGTYFLE